MPLAGCPPNAQRFVKVIKTEEKGSDVNIATYLLRDGYNGLYDVAVLVSNDSDLLEPVRIVRHELDLPVGIVFPMIDQKRHPSQTLIKEASFVKRVRRGALAASQFPVMLKDANGSFTKPTSW